MLLPTLLLLFPLPILSTALPHLDVETALSARAVSPNKTCGTTQPGGSTAGYTCPSDAACCSQYGFCGAADTFCLTTAGCQSRYSNSSSACYAPKSGVTVTIDGTCGATGAGKNGYRCAANRTVTSCCSAAGYCGNTSDHCDVNNGCQAGFGNCTGTKTSRSLFSVPLF